MAHWHTINETNKSNQPNQDLVHCYYRTILSRKSHSNTEYAAQNDQKFEDDDGKSVHCVNSCKC